MSSGVNKTLSRIPIRVIGPTAKKGMFRFHPKRRLLQVAVLLLLVVVPVSGLFRISPEDGALVVLNRQIWLGDFFLISGLWIVLACAFVSLYSVAGTVFCGWACPQNTVSEWANYMTHKLLGKRAEVSLTGEAPRVAAAKNKVLNWSLLGLSFLLAAMFFALVPLLYFYPPNVVWSFMIWRPDTRLAGSLYWIYSIWVLIIFLDIAVIRHFWCRFACVYKVWQHTFKAKETLHVTYDASRADECAKCNYCVTSCFIELNPRKTDSYDSCINCGDCIDACNTLQAKKGRLGLLRFELGEREQSKLRQFRDNSMSLLSRFRWTAPFAALGLLMFAWGLWSYQPYHISAGYLEATRDQPVRNYRIEVTSKRYRPTELSISVEGLPQGDFTLSEQKVELKSAERASVFLAVSPMVQRGLHRFVVVARSNDGWVGRFNIQHFVE
jgi:polyferredoxin